MMSQLPQHAAGDTPDTPSQDETTAVVADRAGPGEAWLRRWPLALALLVVGAAGGVGVSTLHQPSYTSEARIAVGAGDLSTGAIAGFPTAASQLASNYARYVNDRALVGDGKVAVSASPITDSNIIRIEGVSTSRSASTQQVQRVAEALVREVTESKDNDAALSDYLKASQVWAQAQAQQQAADAQLSTLQGNEASPARIAAARDALAQLTSATDVALLEKQALGQQYTNEKAASTAADLKVVTDATPVGDDAGSTRQRYGLLGAVLGLVVSLAVSVALERRRPRGRRSN